MPAPSSHRGKTPSSHSPPGLPTAAEAGEGPRRAACRSGDRGVPAPATPRGCWCPTLAALHRPPPPAAPGAGLALRLGVPPASNPRRSLLSPPCVLREQRRGEELPARHWVKRPRNQKRDGKGKETGKKKTLPWGGKKKVTKGKTTNSLAEYKDLQSDGATTASLERGGHGHAPPASSTTRFGAPGAQRAGVRLSPCPGGEEEGWPGARTAQCSPHPRRGFGEGG